MGVDPFSVLDNNIIVKGIVYMYTLESLKPLNAVFDSRHRLEKSDVDLVNNYVSLIESTRGKNPRAGDIIAYTDEYGDYHHNAHVHMCNAETEQVGFYAFPFGPFVFHDDVQGFRFESVPGAHTSVDFAALTYIGKREKSFKAFGNCGATANGAVYFYAPVNVWEYVAPNQKHPGYSTKDWRKQYISYVEKPADGSDYHYYGQDIVFRNASELQRWKITYKAVEFPGARRRKPKVSMEDKTRVCDMNVQKTLNIMRKIALNLAKDFKFKTECKIPISGILKRNLFDIRNLSVFLDFFSHNIN